MTVFLADVHYNAKRQHILPFLQSLEENPTVSTIIFMGDIFDLLIGSLPYLYERNRPLIEAIERLSYRKKLLYLEGNHDFLLEGVFSNVTVIPLAKQPYQYGTWSLAHGDCYGTWGYRIYTFFIRQPKVITILYRLLGDNFLRRLEERLSKKILYHEWKDFETFALKRLLSNEKIRIEGHFHQNGIFYQKGQTYVAVPSFACSGKALGYQNKEFTIIAPNE